MNKIKKSIIRDIWSDNFDPYDVYEKLRTLTIEHCKSKKIKELSDRCGDNPVENDLIAEDFIKKETKFIFNGIISCENKIEKWKMIGTKEAIEIIREKHNL